MTDPNLSDLIEHLCQNTALDRNDAQRIVDEVLAYFQEHPEQYICRRHREMQLEGLANACIFRTIGAEMKTRVFPATEYSERQIRRTIYG